MKFLTKANRRALPPIGSTALEKDPKAQVKFFDPCGSFTWYATEFDGKDTFFGLVCGFDKELGYFSMSEMQAFKGRFGLGIERDMHFDPTALSEIGGLT